MTPEQLAEIRARLDAATPGPWVRGLDAKAAGVSHPNWGQVLAPWEGYGYAPICEAYCRAWTTDEEDDACRARGLDARRSGREEWHEPAQVAANAALIAHALSDLRALLDEVERLTAERDRLAEALRPFAALAGVYDPPDGDDGSVCWADLPTIGDLRRARAALAPNT